MGLDIYLRKCKNLSEARAVEREYEKKCDKIWGKKTLSDNEKRMECKALAKALGLDEYGSSPDIVKVELPSAKHSEHYFKIGYFRSSYNEAGTNSVLERLGVPNLYQLFNVEGQEPDDLHPDWEDALKETKRAIELFDRVTGSAIGKYDAFVVNTFFYEDGAKSAEEALQVFAKELEKTPDKDFRSYSNKSGEYFLDGMKVYGLVVGKDLMGTPCFYVIHDAEKKFRWYRQALEIVAETCEYVLAQPDKDDYFLVWSG